MQAEDLDSLFLLPLSQQAMEELEILQTQLQAVPYEEDSYDHWTAVWGNTYTPPSGSTLISLVTWKYSPFPIRYGNQVVPRESSSLPGLSG